MNEKLSLVMIGYYIFGDAKMGYSDLVSRPAIQI